MYTTSTLSLLMLLPFLVVASPVAGATEDSPVAGALEASPVAGASKASPVGGESEASPVGGASELIEIGNPTLASFKFYHQSDCAGEIALKYDTTFSGQARKRFDTPMLSVKIKNIPEDKQAAFWVEDDDNRVISVPHIVTAGSLKIPGCLKFDQEINSFQVQKIGVKFDGNRVRRPSKDSAAKRVPDPTQASFEFYHQRECRGATALKFDTAYSGHVPKRFDTPMLSVKIKNIPQDKQAAFWVGNDRYTVISVPHIVTAESLEIPECANIVNGINTFQVQDTVVKFDGNWFRRYY